MWYLMPSFNTFAYPYGAKGGMGKCVCVISVLKLQDLLTKKYENKRCLFFFRYTILLAVLIYHNRQYFDDVMI